jgi:hypothetical protein
MLWWNKIISAAGILLGAPVDPGAGSPAGPNQSRCRIDFNPVWLYLAGPCGKTYILFNPSMALFGPVQSAPPAATNVMNVVLHGFKLNPAVALNLILYGITSTPPAGLIQGCRGVAAFLLILLSVTFNPASALYLTLREIDLHLQCPAPLLQLQ